MACKWKSELKLKGFLKNDPLFPSINNNFDKDGNQISNLSKDVIKPQTTIRNIFKQTFINNSLPYYKYNNKIYHEKQKYGKGTECESAIALRDINLEIDNE